MSSSLPCYKHRCATLYRLKGLIWSKTSEPSLLYACDYDGRILSFNFNDSADEPLIQVNSHEATRGVPLRTITLMNKSIVAGGDNLEVVDFDQFSNYRVLYGHEDFVRRIVSHPKKPWLISSSDDTTIRVWNYETKSVVDKILDYHSHYVMDVAVRYDEEKDFTMIITASLDRSINLFGIVGDGPHQLLGSISNQGEFGVNCVAFVSNDIAVSGSDDKTIKILDLKTFKCLAKDSVDQVVNACKAQKDLIFSCGESGLLFVHRLVIENSGRVELELICKIECFTIGRLWCLDTFWCNYSKQTTIAVGGDEGLYVIQLGHKHSFICTDRNNVLTDLTIICTLENDN